MAVAIADACQVFNVAIYILFSTWRGEPLHGDVLHTYAYIHLRTLRVDVFSACVNASFFRFNVWRDYGVGDPMPDLDNATFAEVRVAKFALICFVFFVMFMFLCNTREVFIFLSVIT